MAEYIDKSALYEKISQIEELAMNRYLETPSNSPCCSMYLEQLNERTAFKHIIADFPSADVSQVRHGRWVPTEAPFMNECEDCSVCGYRTVWGHRYNYCPNCGCRMDGGTD